MAKPQTEMSGVLFRVAEPKTPQHPTFKGSCTIDGRRQASRTWKTQRPEAARRGCLTPPSWCTRSHAIGRTASDAPAERS
jgi:hypothetical protein